MAEPTPYPAPKQKKSRTRVPLKKRHSLFGRKRATSTSLLRHPPKTRRKLVLLRCPHCPFTAYSMRDLRYHEELHQKKSAHECHACSYSVNKLSHLHHHLRLHHSESEKFEAKTVDQEQASRKRAGLECLEDSNAERKVSWSSLPFKTLSNLINLYLLGKKYQSPVGFTWMSCSSRKHVFQLLLWCW